MIVDTLANASLYCCLGPKFEAAFRALATDLPERAPGRYEIEGDAVFAMPQAYRTRPAAGCPWEAHNVYADVQFITAGSEAMAYIPRERLKPRMAYDAKNDATLFDPPEHASAEMIVAAGMFAIFFPHDAHSPRRAVAELPADVRKVVVKVRV